MINTSKGFLNIAQGRLNITSNPDLNLTIDDMGEDRIRMAVSSDVVTMLKTATGRVAVQQITLDVEFNFSIVKTSPLCDRWMKQVQKNGYFGNAQFVGDRKETAFDISNLAITSFGEIDVGVTPAIAFRLSGTLAVNQDIYGIIV